MMSSGRAGWLAMMMMMLVLVPGIGLTQTPVCGDENGNGALDSADVFYLINYFFAGGTSPSNCPSLGTVAPVAKTGQTTCYDAAGAVIACAGTGQDGDLQKGVAWPNPRFTDNPNGTVADNLTGLIWLKNANCATISPATWANARRNAGTLASGACGLTDGSVAGDWRLPNVQELHSLVHYGFLSPALSNAAGTGQWAEGDAFSGVQSLYYWSSTTLVNLDQAWFVSLEDGFVWNYDETFPFRVLAVRGGVAPVCGDENGNGALESADVFYLTNHLFAGGPGPANCASLGAVARVAKTGQTKCYSSLEETGCARTGKDAETQTGVAWPNPRFTSNGNGTVTDNLTGLIWMQNANCFGDQEWANALMRANTLANGPCGLTDGSVAGDWRLPNVQELHSLIDFGMTSPALSNAAGTGIWTEGDAFSGVSDVPGHSNWYWTSTFDLHTGRPEFVSVGQGGVVSLEPLNLLGVWCVRGGQ